jgi:hypothetical protein
MIRMKLFEALALRKALQADLGQLISIRNSTFLHAEDELPEFVFGDLTEQIKKKVNDITKLKLAIMQMNMKHILPNKMTLYEAIIELANIRSAIEQLQNLLQVGRGGLSEYSYRRTSQSELKMKKQEKPENLLKLIQSYEGKRRTLDSMIQEANHKVEITI